MWWLNKPDTVIFTLTGLTSAVIHRDSSNTKEAIRRGN